MMKIFKHNKKKSEFKGIRILGFFIVILEWAYLASKQLKNKKWKKFLKREKFEVMQLADGNQDVDMFWKDSKQLLKDSFIPSEQNNHKPLSLRPKSLATYILIALVVKLSVAGFLYTTYPSDAELSEIVSANMVSLINQTRVEAGVVPIEHNDTLASFARLKGQDMIDRDYFAHDTPDGKRPWEWINRGEYDYIYAGENLAMDFITAEVVHEAFLKSPTHRKNILNPKYLEAGIAVLHGEIEGRDTILLVEFFGSQRKDLDSLALVNTTEPQPVNNEGNAEPVPADIAGVETTQPDPIPTSPAKINEYPGRHKTILEDPTTPTPGPTNEGIIVVATTQQSSHILINEIINYSNVFFIGFLIFVGISLILNIFIKIKVQHASLILQSVVVIALLASFFLVKFHFVETIAPQMLIL